MVFVMNMENPDAVRVVGVSGLTNGPVFSKISEAVANLSPRLLEQDGLGEAMKKAHGGYALISSEVDVVKAPLATAGKTTDKTQHSV
jgi:hypothetical protein